MRPDTADPEGPAEFARHVAVSRETLDRLRLYADRLVQWNRRINLIGRSTVPTMRNRHFLDSAQILQHLPAGTERLADLGSGAGFPGLVLAIMGVPEVHLIERDQRKAAFLQEVARLTEAPASIHVQNVATLALPPIDVVTARALAPLVDLIGWSTPLLRPGGACYFLKGAKVAEELAVAGAYHRFDARLIQSITEPTGAVVKLENIR